MPTANLTQQERNTLERGQGWLITTKGVAVTDHRRPYWDPRLDEEGNIRGWTQLLPGDGPRMARYLANGLKLTDSEGNSRPPHNGKKLIQEIPIIEEPIKSLICPLCNKAFEDKDELISHIKLHSSKPHKAHKHKRKNKIKGG